MWDIISGLEELDLEPAEDPHSREGGVAGREPQQRPVKDQTRYDPSAAEPRIAE